ncbi:MAG: hypothetical protein J7K61_03560 [Thermoplasmata archaeon]|nr:hypothetical protein [Thermoplasmata archaeon]
MKKLLAVFSIFLLLLINIPYSYERNSEINVAVEVNGVKSIIRMNENDAHELVNLLASFENALKEEDKEDAKNIVRFLKNYGFDFNAFLDENKSNAACLFIASGGGIILFTPGVILSALARNGFILPFIVYVIILYAAHLIPFRILLPAAYVMIRNGSMTAIGAKGAWSIDAVDEEKIVTVIAFSGITISVPLEEGLVFMLGTALYIKEGAMFMET